MNPNIYHIDVAVIGAGTAGLAAYRQSIAQGARTLLIEGGPYGTTCARVGCMPSKLLIAAADAHHALGRLHAFGIDLPTPSIDGERVMARDFDRQVAELQVRAAILNRFTRLGTPTTVAVTMP